MNSIEKFGLTLGDHFIHQTPKATGARIEIDEYFGDPIEIDGAPHEHSFVRAGTETRTTVVTIEERGAHRRAWVVSGLMDLVVAKTTGSELWGFLRDEYTTLQETTDRIMATSLVARWRYANTEVDFDKSYAQVRALLLEQFAQVHSYALQQTLYAMGQAVLEESRTSPRSNSRRRRSTTSWLTSRRSASRTPVRSSTPRTDRTA